MNRFPRGLTKSASIILLIALLLKMESRAHTLTGGELTRVEPFSRHMAILNGVACFTKDGHIEHAPITLIPSPFPGKVLRSMARLQKHINYLYHMVACDHAFLYDILQEGIQQDYYLNKLWHIYERVRSEGLAQGIFLGLNRADYMLNVDDTGDWRRAQPKQVEVNLMASSFGGLSQNLVKQHRHILRMQGATEDEIKQVPDNPAGDGLAKGLVYAWRQYRNEKAAILVVVHPYERNVFDQRMVEEALYRQEPRVVVFRRTFEDLAKPGEMVLDEETRKLQVARREVAVIYFRDGYVPEHFRSETSWQVKLALERSTAIKCPCIQYMLANTKLVQKALCDPLVIQKYISDRGVVEQIMSTFAKMYDPRQKEHFQRAVLNPDSFVLKPQREGGGNNFFGAELRDKLLSIQDSPELAAYILMDRIKPPSFYNFAMSPGQPVTLHRMVSELGIFGVFVGAGETMYVNYQCGHLLRSKAETTSEGGVSAGFAFIDSPYMI